MAAWGRRAGARLTPALGFLRQLPWTATSTRSWAAETRTVAQPVEGGHGCIEQRRCETQDVLVGSRDGPGLGHVLHWER
jgi:hypothetical protein